MTSGQILKNGFVREHTFFFDFNGGRTSHIRFCIQGPLGPETLHVFDLANTMGTQYENAPALMERAEVQNTGAVDHLPSLTISGTAFNIEAELELNPGFGVAYNNTPVTFLKQNTPEYAILGLGLRAGEPYQRADLQLRSLTITDLGNVNPQNSGLFFWRLLLNPTLGGDFSGNGSATQQLSGKASRHWHFTANTTFSGGLELLAGYAHAVTEIPTQTALNFLNLGSNLAYDDADKIVLVVKQLVGGTDNGAIVATMNFIESL